ncbi:MAG: hypothetical protein ACKOC5_16355 [Chloroflexota bacterium]
MDTPAHTSQGLQAPVLLDLRAVFWAGLFSAGAYTAVSMLLSALIFGTAWFPMRVAASLVHGPAAINLLEPTRPGVVALGMAIQLALALLYTLFIAFIFHRGGLLLGIAGGALIGLALYAINYNNFGYFFPWIFPLRHWSLLAAHALFGAISGGLYELFEGDEFDKAREREG